MSENQRRESLTKEKQNKWILSQSQTAPLGHPKTLREGDAVMKVAVAAVRGVAVLRLVATWLDGKQILHL
jgi:hypothetical protein